MRRGCNKNRNIKITATRTWSSSRTFQTIKSEIYSHEKSQPLNVYKLFSR